jgi:hypothetical protein
MLITNEFKSKHVELTEQIVTLTEKAARLERKNDVLKGLLIKYVHMRTRRLPTESKNIGCF